MSNYNNSIQPYSYPSFIINRNQRSPEHTRNFPSPESQSSQSFIRSNLNRLVAIRTSNVQSTSNQRISLNDHTIIPQSLPIYSRIFPDDLRYDNYASVEQFLASNRDEFGTLMSIKYKNPHTEALDLLKGVQKELIRRIDITYKNIKDEILATTDPEKKAALARKFITIVEPRGGWTRYQYEVLSKAAKNIVRLFHNELDKITYKQPNRWLFRGPWPTNISKNSWNSLWNGMLPNVKNILSNKVEFARQLLNSDLNNKVGDYFNELMRLTRTSSLDS